MSFSLNTNIGAQKSDLYVNQNSLKQNKTLGALSSGSSLSQGANDAASLAISEKLLAQISGSGEAIQNANDSIGLIQVADSALGTIEDNLQRVQTLTLQASNDTLNDSDRAIIQKEIDTLLDSSDDIATSTSYNGQQLLDGTGGSDGKGTFITQKGADASDTLSITIPDSQTAEIVGNIDVMSVAGRSAALDSLDKAQETLSTTRADLGAAQNGLISSIRNTSLSQINQANSASKLADVDFALESANFSRENILAQSGSFALSQENSRNTDLAGLLG